MYAYADLVEYYLMQLSLSRVIGRGPQSHGTDQQLNRG